MRWILLPLIALLTPDAGAWDRVPLETSAGAASGVVPELPKPDVVPLEGWTGLISVPVSEVGSPGSVRVSFRVAGEDDARFERRSRVKGARVLRFVVAAEDFREVIGKEVRVEVSADEGIALGAVSLERHHELPTRKLRGKANGPLGPDSLQSGALGFDALTEHLHTAFPLMSVVEGGPAEEAGMRAGDLVVAVEGASLPPSSLAPGWDWFERSHEALLGRAIERALGEQRKHVRLTALRGGEELEFTLKLPHRKRLDEGFPLRGGLSEQMRADMLRWVVEHQKPNGTWPGTNAVNPALGALALLSTRDERHLPAIEKTVRFYLEQAPKASEIGGIAFWQTAFQGILFAEYHLAGGELDVLPWMRDALAWLPTVSHECKWGMQALGHGPKGLPYDSKSLIAPTAHLLVFEALARRCGIESNLWEHVEPYVLHTWSDPENGGHGGMGYNASYRDKQEFWSRSGLIALATALRGEHGRMREGLTIFMQERHPWMLNSHAYGEPGAALGLISLSVAQPAVLEEILPQWRWKFLNAWEPGYGLRYTTAHMGAPYMGEDVIVNLGYTILASAATGGLVITGGDGEPWL